MWVSGIGPCSVETASEKRSPRTSYPPGWEAEFAGGGEEELKSLLIKVNEESEKLTKIEIMASGPITSWQIEGGKVETVTDFIFLGSKITVDGDCSMRQGSLVGYHLWGHSESDMTETT